MKRIMVLAHKEELIFQAAAHARNAGLDAGIEMANLRARKETVVISTIQTQIALGKCSVCYGSGCLSCGERGSRRRMEKFDPMEFGLVVIDEAHHAPAKSYRLVLEWYRQNPELKVLMVTATPKRSDKLGMHNVCDSVAYELDLQTAIEDGWLVPIRQRFVTVDSLDLSRVGTKAGGDFKDGELERAFLGESDIEEERLLHSIAKPTLEEANGGQVLVFASGADHTRKLCAAFNAYDGVRAEYVLMDTDKQERRNIVRRYKERTTQVLVGCGVFTEGFDAPETSIVAVARPTKAEALYRQIIGRGTRPLPNIVDGLETAIERKSAIASSAKPHCVILDFVGNSGKHRLMSVADILAGEDVDRIDLDAALKQAKKLGEAVDMEELIEKAKQAREAKEKRKEERAKNRESTRHKAETAEYSATDVDLFHGGKFDPFKDYQPTPYGASQKQVAFLIKLGVSPETASQYTKRQAGAVIDKLTSQSGPEYILTIGKYKGKRLKEVPRGYLEWMLKENVGGDRVKRNIEQTIGKASPVTA